MYEDIDLAKQHEVEQMRRSIAMLPPRASALDREQALRLLSGLEAALKAQS